MKHEHALTLMEIMKNLDYSSECIVLTLMNCEMGKGIGHSLFEARTEIRKEHEIR